MCLANRRNLEPAKSSSSAGARYWDHPHAGGSRIPRRFCPPFDPEPRALLDFGDAHRWRGGRCVQGDQRHQTAAPEDRLIPRRDCSSCCMWASRFRWLGAGIALDKGATIPNTVLGFAILVSLDVSGSGWALLARRPGEVSQTGRLLHRRWWRRHFGLVRPVKRTMGHWVAVRPK
jgi:hypothetical protein